MASSWLKFTWDLKVLPAKLELKTAPLTVRNATKEELSTVIKVVDSAFSMDTGWADIHKQLLERLTAQIETSFSKEPLCPVLMAGQRIVGCSVLRADEEAESQLITGPCILHEYRSRGFGTSLVAASLLALREAGLSKATGLTREKTVAARYLYTKFGGTAVPWTSDLDPRARAAA